MEVELKARVADPGAVATRLGDFATHVRDFDKHDAYWHGPEWRLNRGTKGFRLRSEDGHTTISFKNRNSEGGMEISREKEFEVSDIEVFCEFAERLGCEPFYLKLKRGQRWEFRSGSPHSIALELTEVEGLGWFLEIEARIAEDDPTAVALAQGEIRGLLDRAGIEESAIEARYYSELLLAAGRIAGS